MTGERETVRISNLTHDTFREKVSDHCQALHNNDFLTDATKQQKN